VEHGIGLSGTGYYPLIWDESPSRATVEHADATGLKSRHFLEGSCSFLTGNGTKTNIATVPE